MPPPESTSKIPAPKGDAHVGAVRKRQEKPASTAGPSFLPIWKALKKEQLEGLKSVVLLPSQHKEVKDKNEEKKEEEEEGSADNKPPQVQGEGKQQPPSAPTPAAKAADEGWVYVDEDVDWVVEIQQLKKKKDKKEEEWVAIVPISRE